MVGVYRPSSVKKTKSQILREMASLKKLDEINSQTQIDDKIIVLKKSTSYSQFSKSKSKKNKEKGKKVYINFGHMPNTLTEDSSNISIKNKNSTSIPKLNISSTSISIENNHPLIPPNTMITKITNTNGIILEDLEEELESSKRVNNSIFGQSRNLSYLTEEEKIEKSMISNYYREGQGKTVNYEVQPLYHDEDIPNVANYMTFKQKMRMLENMKLKEKIIEDRKKKNFENSMNFVVEKKLEHGIVFHPDKINELNSKIKSKKKRRRKQRRDIIKDDSLLKNFMKKIDHLTKSSLDLNYSLDNNTMEYSYGVASKKGKRLMTRSKEERIEPENDLQKNQVDNNKYKSNTEQILGYYENLNHNNLEKDIYQNEDEIGSISRNTDLYDTFHKESFQQHNMKKFMPSELSSIGRHLEETNDKKITQNTTLMRLNNQLLQNENSLNHSFNEFKKILNFENSATGMRSNNFKEISERVELSYAHSQESNEKDFDRKEKSRDMFSKSSLFKEENRDNYSLKKDDVDISALIARKREMKVKSKRSPIRNKYISPLKKPLTTTRKNTKKSETKKVKKIIGENLGKTSEMKQSIRTKNYQIETPFENKDRKLSKNVANEETFDTSGGLKVSRSSNNISKKKMKNSSNKEPNSKKHFYQTSKNGTPNISFHLESKYPKKKNEESRKKSKSKKKRSSSKKKKSSMRKSSSRKSLWNRMMHASDRLSKPKSKVNSKVGSSRKKLSAQSSKKSLSKIENNDSIHFMRLKTPIELKKSKSKSRKNSVKKVKKISTNKKPKKMSRISSTKSLAKKKLEQNFECKSVGKLEKPELIIEYTYNRKEIRIETESTKPNTMSPIEGNDTFESIVKPIINTFTQITPPNNGMFSNKIVFEKIPDLHFNFEPIEKISKESNQIIKPIEDGFNFEKLKAELLGFINPEKFETKIQNSNYQSSEVSPRKRMDSAFTFSKEIEKCEINATLEMRKKSSFGPIVQSHDNLSNYESIHSEKSPSDPGEFNMKELRRKTIVKVIKENGFENNENIDSNSLDKIKYDTNESTSQPEIKKKVKSNSNEVSEKHSGSVSFDPNEGLTSYNPSTLHNHSKSGSVIASKTDNDVSLNNNRNSSHYLQEPKKRFSMISNASSFISALKGELSQHIGTEGESFDPNELETHKEDESTSQITDNEEIKQKNNVEVKNSSNNLAVVYSAKSGRDIVTPRSIYFNLIIIRCF